MVEAGPRIKAFLYDYLLIVVYLAILSGLGAFLVLGPLADQWSALVSSPGRRDLLAFLLSVLPVILYFAISESSEAGGTWGKRRVGIRVVGPAGARLSWPRALARSCLKFLPWQMAHTAMFHIPGFPLSPGDPPVESIVLLSGAWLVVGVYFLGLTRMFDHRTLYDRVVGSRVELK